MTNHTIIYIRPARKEQAPEIARLIMMAMTDECCLSFCDPGHGLDDFQRMMTWLVEMDDSQYSYRNTWVAIADDDRAATVSERVAGIAVSYDGARLHELRRPFLRLSLQYLGADHSGMDDETQAGELYLDSLAVLPEYRRRGIALRLIGHVKERADQLGLPCVGLLVDKGNPTGEALYAAAGFRYTGDSRWGGHAMRHMVL